MNPYIKITAITFTTWILSSVINGLMCGIFIAIATHQFHKPAEFIIVIFFFSMLFSAPGFFIFWIILLIGFANSIQQRALFRTALSAGFVLAAITAVISSKLIRQEFPSINYVIMFLIILSAITSIMMHFKHFKKIKTKNYEVRVI